ncbi:carbonic anhydrase family protein [Chryseolinea soli]|uniref:Carbonic anhydrase n=1 Tax=Chryseolinea soli TaxID=2321403 RepID=A0A385SV61_9BACT|nr:carbonic anhydrase family protein [Chryseolinea soli]AYB35733.1 carbonic anhydrase [Chryseolinea soli]
MKSNFLSICTAAVVMASMLFSCNSGSADKNNNAGANDSTQTTAIPAPRKERVLTAEEQAALTPDDVIKSLKEGNERFVTSNVTARDHSAMVRDAAQGQFPKAVILSCIDSRIPVEDVFDKGIGDLFVGRVAGNFVNTDLLGSMEFGCKVSGAKLILVLGHESCGAIKSAIDDVKLGNITSMLANIRPAVIASQDFSGEKSSKNEAFVNYVLKNNVIHTIKNIKDKSPILKEMADKGEIKIVGAYYNIQTGAVTFME